MNGTLGGRHALGNRSAVYFTSLGVDFHERRGSKQTQASKLRTRPDKFCNKLVSREFIIYITVSRER